MRSSLVILTIVALCSSAALMKVLDSYRTTGHIRYGKIAEIVVAAGSIYAVARFSERRIRR